MFFFLLNVLLSAGLAAAIWIVLAKSLTVNWRRKNRRPLSYLMPVVLTFILLYLALIVAVPRALDGIDLLADSYSVEEVIPGPDSIGRNVMRIQDRTFFFSSRQLALEPGLTYRIRYTRRSRFIISADLLSE